MNIEEKISELVSLGFQLGNEVTAIDTLTMGGRRKQFENAIIYESPEGEAYEVHGAILAKYLESYEMDGDLGFPASDELDDDVAGGRINFFDRGYISWTPAGGAEVNLSDSIYENSATDTLLADKLSEIAAYAFSMLSLPLQKGKDMIERTENLSSGIDWCGYALAHFYRKVGADTKQLSAYFGGVGGLLNYGSYYRISYDGFSGELISKTSSAKITKIMDENGEYISLEDYHLSHNSLRKITLFSEIQQETPLDILPGDIVLFDHKGKSGPDHIQVVYKWDETERQLMVIDGNGVSFVERATGANEVVLSGSDISKDHIAKIEKLTILNQALGLDLIYTHDEDKGGRLGITMHRLTSANQINTSGVNSISDHARIWAIIRPSIIDFEQHQYKDL